jgi:LmbE family N-acetylglucosaminyl deacetylase
MIVRCLSVHPDDAAFSVATTLSQLRAEQKKIVVVFNRSRWAWGRTWERDRTAERMQEERQFATLVNATVTGLDFTAASAGGDADWDSRHPLEAALEAFLEAAASQADLVLLPVGVSNHPDHIIVREVLGDLFQRWARGGPWVFYEDLPYAVHHPRQQAFEILSQWGFLADAVCVEGTWSRKKSLLAPYRSQWTAEIERDLLRSGGRETLFLVRAAERIFPHASLVERAGLLLSPGDVARE